MLLRKLLYTPLTLGSPVLISLFFPLKPGPFITILLLILILFELSLKLRLKIRKNRFLNFRIQFNLNLIKHALIADNFIKSVLDNLFFFLISELPIFNISYLGIQLSQLLIEDDHIRIDI